MQPEKITYRTIILRNGKYLKTMHRCLTRETAFRRFIQFKEENKVLFPKKFVNDKRINPVEYKICVIKDTEDDDTFRTIRDKMGKTKIEKPLGDWTILDDAPYEVEETFWVYGFSPVHERKNIVDVMRLVAKNSYSERHSKQIIVVHNKLIIHNEDQFDMVICKCTKDAQRLHHAIAKAARKNKMKSLIFMGTATPATVSKMYEIIQENTEWPLQKIWRKTTSHN
jgi:hypothetical protein